MTPRNLALLPFLLLSACTIEPALKDDEETGPVAQIQPGLYESSDTLYVTDKTGAQDHGWRRMRLQVIGNGLYAYHEFFTSRDSLVVDFRIHEESGSLEQLKKNTILRQTLRRTRTFEALRHSAASWQDVYENEFRVRAVDSTGSSFQTSQPLDVSWRIWHRISAPDLQSTFDTAEAYVNPPVGYRLRIPEPWTTTVNYSFNITNDFYTEQPNVDGSSARVSARTWAKATGATLETRMDSVIAADGAFYGSVTVLSRVTAPRGGRTVVTAVVRTPFINGYAYRRKLILFEGPQGTYTLLTFHDLDHRYDQNTDFGAIDSSLTFF